ncbi:MAG: ribonuclease E/G [Gammaproteobacteria bacterium AqS3]|nr:ribonuclease E/G [Gammaproteobacteria bacterium AqS3]
MPGKQILFNVINPKQYRVAVLEESSKRKPKIAELELISPYDGEVKGQIFKGRITRVVSSLEAAFVDIGLDRDGFLSFSEVPQDARDELADGMELLVMVKKDTAENKGVELTLQLEFQSDFFVLEKSRDGVQQRISQHLQASLDAGELEKISELMQGQSLPAGYSLILRTAGAGQPLDELQEDIDALLRVCNECEAKLGDAGVPVASSVYEGDSTLREIIRRYAPSAEEILVDDEEFYYEVRALVRRLVPWAEGRLSLHDVGRHGNLFVKRNIESQAGGVFERRVEMLQGGSVVFDQTEALVAIDVNSGLSKRSGASPEKAALNCNLRAVELICSQLSLRDIGGLVVIDFIDMEAEGRSAVEAAMKKALNLKVSEPGSERLFGSDVHTSGRIDPILGLYSLARRRSRKPLIERFSSQCRSCTGTGWTPRSEIQAQRLVNKIAQCAGSYHANGEPGDQFYVEVRTSCAIARLIAEQFAASIQNFESSYHRPIVIRGELNRPDADVSVELVKVEAGEAEPITEVTYQSETAPDLQSIALRGAELRSIAEAARPQVGLLTRLLRALERRLGMRKVPDRLPSGGRRSQGRGGGERRDRDRDRDRDGGKRKRTGKQEQRKGRAKRDEQGRREKPAPRSKSKSSGGQAEPAESKGGESSKPKSDLARRFPPDSEVEAVVQSEQTASPVLRVELEGGAQGVISGAHILWGVGRAELTCPLLPPGEKIQGRVLSVDDERGEVRLQRLSLHPQTGEEFLREHAIGARLSGVVRSIHPEQGICVELAPGIGGIVEPENLDWQADPAQALVRHAIGDTVEVLLLRQHRTRRAIQLEGRNRHLSRIYLSIKHAQSNAVEDFLAAHPAGSQVSGRAICVNSGNVVVQLADSVDGVFDRGGRERGDVSLGDEVRVELTDSDACRVRGKLLSDADADSDSDAAEAQPENPRAETRDAGRTSDADADADADTDADTDADPEPARRRDERGADNEDAAAPQPQAKNSPAAAQPAELVERIRPENIPSEVIHVSADGEPVKSGRAVEAEPAKPEAVDPAEEQPRKNAAKTSSEASKEAFADAPVRASNDPRNRSGKQSG